MSEQATIGTNIDGTLLISNATNGFTVQDSQGFMTTVKETLEGLIISLYDGINAPTVYEIIGGKLKNILEIAASVNGVFNQAITDELAAANHYPREGDIILSGGNSYRAITVEPDVSNENYSVDFSDLGRFEIEGQISDIPDDALTAELKKLSPHKYTASERITYVDGTDKTVTVYWAKLDTKNKKYIVSCGVVS